VKISWGGDGKVGIENRMLAEDTHIWSQCLIQFVLWTNTALYELPMMVLLG
jgi:hypothetical protein